MHHPVKLTNAFAIGINEMKLNVSVFNSQIMIQDFDLVRLDRSTKVGGVASFIRYSFI